VIRIGCLVVHRLLLHKAPAPVARLLTDTAKTPFAVARFRYDLPMNSNQGNPWQRVSRRVAYANPWIEILHDEVIRPDGAPGIYGVVHFRHLAIGVVPLDTEQDRVLLVGQFRYTMNRYSWEIPEGGGDFDEFPEAAARRELAEETGYVGGEWRELLRAELSNSVSDEITILFAATGLDSGPASPEGTEQLQLRWVAFDEVMAMIANGEIADAMTILAMQQLALERATSRR
jgi:8-oxo-dGTP pyrophosphatase MutT (NUDIX family)